MPDASRICQSVKIHELYHALTGVQPKCIRGAMYRGPASWRSGDNPSAVSLDSERGIWHDFVTDQGGGILDLVIAAKGGTRAEALRLVADFAGVPLNTSEKQDPDEQQRWIEHKRTLANELATAKHWRHAMLEILEVLLTELKRPLSEDRPFPADFQIGEIYEVTKLLQRTRNLPEGLELIDAYHAWFDAYPGYTTAFVRWSQEYEQQLTRAVLRYLGLR